MPPPSIFQDKAPWGRREISHWEMLLSFGPSGPHATPLTPTRAPKRRSIWDYDVALGSAVKHLCEFKAASRQMQLFERVLYTLKVGAYFVVVIVIVIFIAVIFVIVIML